MKAGIRVKFVGILILATVLPLALGVSAVYLLGNRYYRESAGRVFQNRAVQMASYLEISVNGHAEALHDWLALADFYHQIAPPGETGREMPDADLRTEIETLENRWEDLPESGREIQEFIRNEIALELRQFQEVSPSFAEIFVTDSIGRLVATTNKTTNYWHASEHWWQQGMEQEFDSFYVEGVNYDESAGIYSFDLIIPIRDWRNPDAPPVGVVKGVLSAAPLFQDLSVALAGEETEWLVVLEDGSLLFGPVPVEERISERATATLHEYDTGWMLRRLNQEAKRMAGFAKLPWESSLLVNTNGGLSSIYVLVHESAAAVLAPVRMQLLLITGAGALLILICFLGGLYLAQYHIIRPIRLLQKAARDIAGSARMAHPEAQKAIREAVLSPSTRKLLQGIARIRSEDELGDLARDFNLMAQRVLNYHAHLEAEIKTKLAEIQGDLVIAREFQEALMPRNYPIIPAVADQASLSLEFNHIYKPASTVGGDFFNVVKLSENKAGIFIADVMGHGSRSALVTAIVATLLHDLAPKSADPAEFMTVLNQHFHHLIQHSKQVIFVTAFYLVIDTRERQAQFASAGHPPPLLVQRKKSLVKPLIHPMQNDTALGLLEDSSYACFSRPVTESDMFLLFTDGLFEALNPKGEEFGVQKLMDVVNHNLEFSASELGRRILDTVNRYSGFAAQVDDICLVSVEINDPSTARQAVEVEHDRKGQF